MPGADGVIVLLGSMRHDSKKESRTMKHHLLALVAPVRGPTAFAGGAPAPDYGFDWVTIGDAGNAPYDGRFDGFNAGRGAVNYEFRIARTEITSAQWLEFINIFAPQSSNPFSAFRPLFSGLTPTTLGQYRLNTFLPDAANIPVTGITWRDAAMFCNWLHNDKSTDPSAILSGAYDASTFFTDPADNTFTDQATRSPGAKFWIPSLDEWIKAAHWDPDKFGDGEGGWWRFSHSSDEPPIPGPPGTGETSAGDFIPNMSGERFIPLGSYVDVVSPWGLWDTSGGTTENLEDRALFNQRTLDGSAAGVDGVMNDHIGYFSNTSFSGGGHGFRVASVIPAPGALVACAGFISWFNRRRKR